jgi:hypothetical protein
MALSLPANNIPTDHNVRERACCLAGGKHSALYLRQKLEVNLSKPVRKKKNVLRNVGSWLECKARLSGSTGN